MSKAELLKLLQSLDLDTVPSVELYILDEPTLDEDGDLSVNIYRGRMHQDMPGEIVELFYPRIKRILVEREYTLEAYNPELNPDRNVVWQYPTGEVPFYNKILEGLPNAEDVYYDDDELPYERIWAVWIKLKIKKAVFYILKKITPSKVLTTGGVMALVFRSQTFRSLKKDVLTMDGSFDVFVCNDTLVFENKQNFERALLYEEIKQEVANETLEEIRGINIIENFDAFKDMLANDKHSINKLNKLKSKRYFREKTFKDYCKIIRDYGVAIGIDETGEQFAITGKAQAKLLVKVLNDDYLKSELTAIKYSAHSKEDI